MKVWKKFLPVVALALVLAFVFAGNYVTKAENTKEKRIVEGVSIGKVDVSGMTAAEATAAVNSFVTELAQTEVTLQSENGEITATFEEMGLSYDIETAVSEAVGMGNSGSLIRRFKETKDLEKAPQVVSLRLKVDNQTTATLLYDNGDELNLEPVNMGLEKSGDKFVTTPGKNGNEVDYVESVSVINDYINAWVSGAPTTIALVCHDVDFKGSEEELANVTDILGSFSTWFGTGTSGRETNVKNGCRLISGHVIYPGDEFSANAAMDPYTYENGFADGGSYENGKVVTSIGGGICQVSTTLYNAVIRSELEITKRACHSMIVSYVQPSEDAAIAGDWKDLRFKNNTDYPIYIEGYCSGGNIYFNIWGKETRAAGHAVSFESEVLETEVPESTYVLSGDQPVGYYSVDVTAHIGYKARLWKITTENGVETERKVCNNSTYQSSPATVTIGVAGATAEQLAKINEAIAKAKEAKDDTIVEAACAGLTAPAETTTPEVKVEKPVDNGTIPVPTDPTVKPM